MPVGECDGSGVGRNDGLGNGRETRENDVK